MRALQTALLALGILLLPGAKAPPSETVLAQAEAKAGRGYASAQEKLGRWCLEHKFPSAARTAFQETLRLDGRNAAVTRLLEALPAEDGPPPDAKLAAELDARRSALAKDHAKAFAQLAQQALKAKAYGLARRAAHQCRSLRPEAPELAALDKGLEEKEAAAVLGNLDAEMAQARETHVLRPEGAGTMEYVLRLPKDHDPDRRWPLYIFIHGNSPDKGKGTLRFNEPLRDAGFALLGPSCGSSLGAGSPVEEMAQVLRIVDRLSIDMGIDPDQVFLAAHSGGGTLAYTMLDQCHDRLRGVIPIEANFHGIGISKRPKPDPFPVYVFKGEKDEHNAAILDREIAAALDALKAAQYTNVTYEVVPGMTHTGFVRCEGKILAWCQGILSNTQK